MKTQITLIVVIAALVVIAFIGSAYTREPQQPGVEYAQVTALESQIAGGAGRSRLYITHPDGKQEVADLSNYKSMTGINFQNVSDNERTIVTNLKKMTDQGYEIRWVESGVSEGIYITKYIMTRKQ